MARRRKVSAKASHIKKASHKKGHKKGHKKTMVKA